MMSLKISRIIRYLIKEFKISRDDDRVRHFLWEVRANAVDLKDKSGHNLHQAMDDIFGDTDFEAMEQSLHDETLEDEVSFL